MDGGVTLYLPTEDGEGIVAGGSILQPCPLSFKQTSEIPQSVNGVRSGGRPPPFLTKVLLMVEDPETNYLISWDDSGTSFIIWDHLKFAKELLPKYFKHSNFSSFIYQLNNYGFKKIGLREYEYENKWFQAGKQHLLMNMKRRTDVPASSRSTGRQRGPRKVCHNTEESRRVVKLENLREIIYLNKLETQKLKQKIVELENHIATFKEQGKDLESKEQKMFLFLGTILSPSIVHHVIESSGEERELESHESIKEMWLTTPKTTMNSSLSSDHQVNNLNGNNQEIPTEKQIISYIDDDLGSQIPGQEVNDSTSEAIAAKNCNALINWQKFLEDYPVSENEAEQEELAQQHFKIDIEFDDMMTSKIVMEVEDVIAKEPITDMDDEVTLQLWA